MDPDLIDEDASMRRNLAALGPDALCELQTVLDAPQPYRDAVSRALVARPELSELATLLAMEETDRIVRLRLLRALRDLGVEELDGTGARPGSHCPGRAPASNTSVRVFRSALPTYGAKTGHRSIIRPPMIR